jgi:hypothetical protein
MAGVYRASVYTNQKEHWKYDLMSEVYPDGTFEVLPILQHKEPCVKEDCYEHVRRYLRTYADVPSWHHPKQSVVDFLNYPGASDLVVHDDPDLHTLMAYGDIRLRHDGRKSVRGSGLFSMKPGDWITSIAHLAYAKRPGEPDPTHKKTGWYLVGCLRAQHIDFAGAGREFSDRAKGHAHWLWGQYDDMTWGKEPHNMIVCGDRQRRDQRFETAIPVLTREDAMRLIRDKQNQPLDPTSGNQTVKSSIGSHTRTGRCIGDTTKSEDKAYLGELRSAILERNPSLHDLLW